MDIEGFVRELNNRMNSFIEWEHTKAPNDAAIRASTLGRFRQELKTTINKLMDERRITFNHDVEVGNFMTQLNTPIENLMNKYING